MAKNAHFNSATNNMSVLAMINLCVGQYNATSIMLCRTFMGEKKRKISHVTPTVHL